MFKRIKTLILSTFILFNLASCSLITSNTTYTFKDITNHEISDINQVLINNGYMTSSQFLFEGDYEKILDVDYILSNVKYNDAKNIKENYRYWLNVNFTSNNGDTNFYAFENKLYYFSDDSLYESKNVINYIDFKNNDKNINSNNNSSSKEELQTINTLVMVDYGVHVNGKVTVLLGIGSIWFNPKDYGINSLVAGDELIIKYTGELEILEVYPARVNAEKIHIESIEVIKADIIELEVMNNNEEVTLVSKDSKYNNYTLANKIREGYVISKDLTFKKYNELELGTIVYGSLLKTTGGSIRIEALYDYNPREEVAETGQFKLQIIDHTDRLITELSNSEGFYTPGRKLSFYFDPITEYEAEIAMYVNNKHHSFHKSITLSDRVVWEITFEMTIKDTIIEFYIVQYMPVNN